MGDLSLGETTMVTFVHSADWQLGKPFSRVSDDGKRTRLQEQRIAAVRRIGEVVKKHDAAFVVVAGDVFDSNSPTNTVVADACDAIKSIGAPVYVIPGNHDHAGPGSVWSQPFFLRVSKDRAPNLRVLLDREPVQEAGCILFPCPLSRRQSGEDPCTWIRNHDFSGLEDRPRIVLAHGSTLNFRQESDEEDNDRQPNLIALDVHSATFATDAGPAAVKDSLDQLVGDAERGLSLLKLSLGGNLGLAGHAELSTILEEWQAGLLDLRLDKSVAVAPTADEIDALAHTTVHPLIAHVARELQDQIARGGEEARLAGTAIALLHEFANAGGAA